MGPMAKVISANIEQAKGELSKTDGGRGIKVQKEELQLGTRRQESERRGNDRKGRREKDKR